MRLADAQLDSLEQWAACDLADTEGVEVGALIAEVRESRALLATPLPCGFDEPRFVRQVGHGGIDGVEWNPFGTRGGGIAYEPDEAVAIGAALIRAALEAQSALAGKGEGR